MMKFILINIRKNDQIIQHKIQSMENYTLGEITLKL